MWSRTPSTSKLTARGRRRNPHPPAKHHQRAPVPLFAATSGRRSSQSLCPLGFGECVCGNFGGVPRAGSDSSAPVSLRVFGVVLILVDFVLVIVDISLYDRSREVGDALEVVSLLISLFFLADVLLRVFVEG